MSATANPTTLLSLFHTPKHATQALEDLREAGIPVSAIQTLASGASETSLEQSVTTLKRFNLPDQDLQVLGEGLKNGGSVIIVRAEHGLSEEAENIFERYNSHQIDERSNVELQKATAATTTGDVIIPVVEESLVVSKRKVQKGGVRVFSRIVETPVEEQVVLREEHATIERRPVNQSLSSSKVDALRDQTFDVHEMAEEAVVGKTARVVEEVRVGTEGSDRTHVIRDTVRKTEVEVDELALAEKGHQPKG